MRVEFETLEIEGFKSFAGKQVFDLTALPLGLIFMSGRNEIEPRLGSNGSGKSSTWDCLCWILYGATPSGLRSTDIRSWAGAKTARGLVNIRVDDERHTVERTANPNKLKVDGTEAGPDAITKLLGMDFDLFVQTVLMAQGRPLFLDLLPSEKMSLFVNVLQLERWDQRSQEAAVRVRELEKVEGDIRQDLAAIEGAIAEINTSMKQVQAQSHDWEAQRQSRIDKLQADLAASEGALPSLEDRYGEADLTYDGALTEIKLVLVDQDKLRKVRDRCKEAHDKSAIEIEAARRSMQSLQNDLKSLGSGDACPTCGQPLKGTSLGQHKRETEKRIADLQAVVKAGVPSKVAVALTEAQQRLDAYEEEIRRKRATADAAGNVRDSLYPLLAECRARITQLRSRIDDGVSETNPFLEQVSKLRTRRAKLLKEEKDCNKELDATLRSIEQHKFWIKGFRDIRLYIINEVMEDLEVATNAMLEEMGLVGWEMRFDTERETASKTIARGINVTVLSPTNKEAVRWQAWSGGESQRLRLVGSLALSEVLLNHAGIECGLEVLDEPTRHLSAEGIRDIHEFLADRSTRLGKQIIYVDHAAISSRYFADTVTVVKDARGSRFA